MNIQIPFYGKREKLRKIGSLSNSYRVTKIKTNAYFSLKFCHVISLINEGGRMKLLFSIIVSLMLGTVATANAKQLVCIDQDSKLTLDSEKTLMGHEGLYEYNKMDNGEYASLAVLGCDLKTGKANDIFDCTETTYGVYWSIYKAPKNMFASKKSFSLTEIRREEDGEITGKSIFKNCKIIK